MNIVNFQEYINIRDKVKAQCELTRMWVRGSHIKKINAILDSICIAIINSNLTSEDIDELFVDINSNNVINTNILTNGGCIWDYINTRWVELAKQLFSQRTIGIGTPNAASGEGELMFLFLGGNVIFKPTKGDLQIGTTKFELKGEGPRIMGNISGNNFRRKTLICARNHNIQPNISTRNGNEAVELEKEQHKEFYWNQLCQLTLDAQKSFCNDWLKCIDDRDHNNEIDKVFQNGHFDFHIFRKEIVKCLFKIHLQKYPFDYYVMLGDGNNVKVFSSNIEQFNAKIDSNEIELSSDYFRINQDFPIGWYIK